MTEVLEKCLEDKRFDDFIQECINIKSYHFGLFMAKIFESEYNMNFEEMKATLETRINKKKPGDKSLSVEIKRLLLDTANFYENTINK